MGDGTLAYTSVLLDDSTTVIDGGNIITGTVTANKLNAANINASKSLTVGAMTDAAASSILNSNVVAGGDNLVGNFNYTLVYNSTGTLTSLTTTNTANNSVYIQALTGTTSTSAGTFVREIANIGNSSNVGQIIHGTFEKTADFTHIKLKFNGNKSDADVFWDISSIPTGTQLTLSCKLDSISSDGKGNGGVLSGINLRAGNAASQWSLAPRDETIGGRNLLLWTGESETYSDHSAVDRRWDFSEIYGTNTVSGNTVTFTKNANGLTNHTSGIRVSAMLSDGRKATATNLASLSFGLDLKAGDTLTFSCDVKTSGNRVALHAQYFNGTDRWKDCGAYTEYGAPVDTDWHRYSHTFTVASNYVSLTALGIYCELKEGVTISARNFKLEKGNKATDWTPAPEDVDSAIEQSVAGQGGFTIL